MNALGLYVHIPFCTRKCAYCDFVSFPDSENRIDSYIEAVIDEARLYEDVLFSRGVDTVFIGGGTPSLLSPLQIEKLLTGLRNNCNWKPLEVSVEANPESVDADKIAAYADNGVNRISFGLQTHDDVILNRIGRGHTWETFLKSFDKATGHLNNVNVDTIFGLPGQTLETYLETLGRVIALSPTHLSSYALKLEPGTPLACVFSGADEELDRVMHHTGIEMLEAAGFRHYETSNFAQPGCECRHNLKYWTGGEYLGLGVAAHSFLRIGNPVRMSNTTDLDNYIHMIGKGLRPVTHTEVLSPDDIKSEYIMLYLRLKDGLSFSDYKNHFQQDFQEEFAKEIKKASKAGLIIKTSLGIIPTIRGFDLQNALIGEFMKKI
jgi:oxygen-independent coproporphyrinogen-3 oxidase